MPSDLKIIHEVLSLINASNTDSNKYTSIDNYEEINKKIDFIYNDDYIKNNFEAEYFNHFINAVTKADLIIAQNVMHHYFIHHSNDENNFFGLILLIARNKPFTLSFFDKLLDSPHFPFLNSNATSVINNKLNLAQLFIARNNIYEEDAYPILIKHNLLDNVNILSYNNIIAHIDNSNLFSSIYNHNKDRFIFAFVLLTTTLLLNQTEPSNLKFLKTEFLKAYVDMSEELKSSVKKLITKSDIEKTHCSLLNEDIEKIDLMLSLQNEEIKNHQINKIKPIKL